MKNFGTELIIDLYECDVGLFNRDDLTRYLVEVCDLIGMKRADLHFWDYEGDDAAREAAPAHLAGISAVQFIETSNITIHTLDKLRTIYVNIFSCAEFNHDEAFRFTKAFFDAHASHVASLERLLPC